MTSSYTGLTRLSKRPGLTRTDPQIWPGPNCLPKKKERKKRERENALTDWTLTLTKKSKFSKWTYPTQFFEYIPILGFVSSFETRKSCKRPISRKLTFAQIRTKSQNFQVEPVLPNFSRRFRFWGLFLHLRIWNCSNSVILQLLALMWTLTKNQDVRATLVLLRFSHKF